MKLFITPNSPYARVARVALREAGLDGRVAEIAAANRQDDNPVLGFSPVGRVPTLVDGDLLITELTHVVAYISQKGRTPVLQASSWPERADEGLILGFLEGIAFWVRENRRGAERSEPLIEVERKRAVRCLHQIEARAKRGALPAFPAFRSIVLATALELMDLRALMPGWQQTWPALADWFQLARQRPAMRETKPGAL